MGLLRSKTDHTGMSVSGVTLGAPLAPVRVDGSPMQPGDSLVDLYICWDDSAFPYGEIDELGNIEIDEVSL